MNKEQAKDEIRKSIRRINHGRKDKIKYYFEIVIDGETIKIKSANYDRR